jgi:hypothetical protein
MNDGEMSKCAGLGLPLAGMAAFLILGALMFTSQKVDATPVFAQKTGKGCPTCHTNPPVLNGTGKKYKQTGKL